MVIIKLQDSTAEKLTRIASRRGMSLDALVEEMALSAPDPDTNGHTPEGSDAVSPAERLARFEAMMEVFKAMDSRRELPPGFVLDDSRDSIYEGRGE